MPENAPVDPAPAAPTDPKPSAFLSLVGPLLAGFLGPQGSLRRFVVGVAGAAVLALNHKLGLGLDVTEQGILASVIVAMVATSNAKEAIVAHANAKVMAANADANATVETAKIEAATVAPEAAS